MTSIGHQLAILGAMFVVEGALYACLIGLSIAACVTSIRDL